MNKHTPGPWTLFQDQSVKHYAGIEAGNLSIVSIGYPELIPAMDDSGVHGRTEEEALANAYLIAAAPDLLEALELVWPFLYEDDDDAANSYAYQHAIDKVRAAITKIKGKIK
jgi:hypothetical protein